MHCFFLFLLFFFFIFDRVNQNNHHSSPMHHGHHGVQAAGHLSGVPSGQQQVSLLDTNKTNLLLLLLRNNLGKTEKETATTVDAILLWP